MPLPKNTTLKQDIQHVKRQVETVLEGELHKLLIKWSQRKPTLEQAVGRAFMDGRREAAKRKSR